MPAIQPNLRPLIISAPFGNYIQPEGATATLGTFTAARRRGRAWRIIRTVRWYPRIGAWVNKIGLRNPGIDWLAGRARDGKVDAGDKIVSVHGFTPDDWSRLIRAVAEIRPAAIELNMSCPNVGHINWPPSLFADAVATGLPVIAKLPPVNYHDMAAHALDAGIRAFHCCNTLPVPAGGVSGKPLKPVALACIRDLRARTASLADDLTIIGGGGITTPGDIAEYAEAGATHFAIATKVFNPRYLVSCAALKPLLDAASRHARSKPG